MMKRYIILVLGCLVCMLLHPRFLQAQAISLDAQLEAAFKHLVSGDDARDNGQTAQAIAAYRTALSAYKDFAAKHPDIQAGVVKYRIGYCTSQLDTLGAEEEQAKKTAEQKPPEDPPIKQMAVEPPAVTNISAAVAMARDYIAKGAADEARSVLLEALKKEPDNKPVRLLLAVVQCQSARYNDAASVLKSLIDEDPRFAPAHAAFGTVLFAQGKPDEALDSLKKAIELNPNMGEAYFDIAQIYLSRKPPEIEAAAMYYRKALGLGIKPDDNMDAILKN